MSDRTPKRAMFSPRPCVLCGELTRSRLWYSVCVQKPSLTVLCPSCFCDHEEIVVTKLLFREETHA